MNDKNNSSTQRDLCATCDGRCTDGADCSEVVSVASQPAQVDMRAMWDEAMQDPAFRADIAQQSAEVAAIRAQPAQGVGLTDGWGLLAGSGIPQVPQHVVEAFNRWWDECNRVPEGCPVEDARLVAFNAVGDLYAILARQTAPNGQPHAGDVKDAFQSQSAPARAVEHSDKASAANADGLSDENGLLPCPFCGAHLPHMWSLTMGGVRHTIKCTECPGRAEFHSSTREQAIAAWNRRATPSSPSTASEVGEQSEWQMYADKFGVDPETIDYDSEQWKGFIAGIECARAALAAKTATTMEKTVAQEGEE